MWGGASAVQTEPTHVMRTTCACSRCHVVGTVTGPVGGCPWLVSGIIRAMRSVNQLNQVRHPEWQAGTSRYMPLAMFG